MFITYDFLNGENIIYKCGKGRLRIIAYIICVISGIVCFTKGFGGVIDYFHINNINFQMQDNYFFMIFGSFITILSFSVIYSYIFDTLIITENHIFIRRGFRGKIYKIAKTKIKAVCNIINYSRGGTSYKIQILTSDGNIISTGDLHCTKRTFEEITDRMDYISVASKKELLNIQLEKNNLVTDDKTVMYSNIIFPLFIYFLYFILSIAIIVYGAGINEKCGEQREFTIQGINGKCVGTYKGSPRYSIAIVQNNSENTYWIDVKRDVYDSVIENKKTKVTGLVGCLGVIYDLKIENVD